MTERPADAPADRLPPRAFRYLAVRSLIEVAVGSLVLAAAAAWIPDPAFRSAVLIAIGALALAAVVVEIPLLDRRRVATTRYAVSAELVRVRHGLLIRREVSIATPQILNVEIVDGPLLRAFGLASVRLTTIGGAERLGPLEPDAAGRVRDAVLGAVDGVRA
jgi:uncharacterized protein